MGPQLTIKVSLFQSVHNKWHSVTTLDKLIVTNSTYIQNKDTEMVKNNIYQI